MRRLLRIVARNWRTVMVFALCGGVLGGLSTMLISSNPRSTTTVFVTPLAASPFSPDPRGQTLTDLETEAQVVKSDAVLTLAAEKLGNRLSPAKIDAVTQVGIPVGSQVLAISFTEAPPVAAEAGSDAVAEAFLEVRQERAQQSIQSQLDAIGVAENQTTKELRQAAQKARTSGVGSARRRVAEQQVAVASGTLTSLADQRSTLVAASTSPGEILSPGSASSGSTPLFGAVAGLLIGILLGGIWVVYRDVRKVSAGAGLDHQTVNRDDKGVYHHPTDPDASSTPAESPPHGETDPTPVLDTDPH